MTKRIKIERASDVVEGMEIEVQYRTGRIEVGKVIDTGWTPDSPEFYIANGDVHFLINREGEFCGGVLSVVHIVDELKEDIINKK